MSRYFRLVAFSAALVLLVQAAPAAAGPPLATGHVNLEHEAPNELLTISFNVIDTGDYTASGHLQAISREGGGYRIHAVVQCGFVDGNSVFFTSLDENFPGVTVVFGARDNGEGKKAEPDQFTNITLFSGLPSNCEDLAVLVAAVGGVNGAIAFIGGLAHTSDGGNIQVH